MPELSGSKIMYQQFRIGKNECELLISYDMILGEYMMVQIELIITIIEMSYNVMDLWCRLAIPKKY